MKKTGWSKNKDNEKRLRQKPSDIQRDCMDLLQNRGYFRWKVYCDGAMFILAMKSGKTYALVIRSGSKRKAKYPKVLDEIEKAGGQAFEVRSAKELETLLPMD